MFCFRKRDKLQRCRFFVLGCLSNFSNSKVFRKKKESLVGPFRVLWSIQDFNHQLPPLKSPRNQFSRIKFATSSTFRNNLMSTFSPRPLQSTVCSLACRYDRHCGLILSLFFNWNPPFMIDSKALYRQLWFVLQRIYLNSECPGRAKNRIAYRRVESQLCLFCQISRL